MLYRLVMTGLILVVSVLAGCGNDPGSDEEAVAATTAATTTSTTTTTTTIPPEPECQGKHRQATWQVTGGWKCEPIPEHLIDLDCIGDMVQVFSSDTGHYKCERPPAPECDDNLISEWSEETRVWKCHYPQPPGCIGDTQAIWQVTGGWKCEPIPEYLIYLDCIGDMVPRFSVNHQTYRCTRPPAPECDDNSTSEWSEETSVWKCRRLTRDEKAAKDCIGSPTFWNGEFEGRYSPRYGYRCLVLICEIPKQDHPSDRWWSNHACYEYHRNLTLSEVAVMEFQFGDDTIKDLEKKFRSCRAESWVYADRITEYNTVTFWCHLRQ